MNENTGKDRHEKTISRRDFIARSAAAAMAAGAGLGGSLRAAESGFHAVPSSSLPARAFGTTGARLPLLTFGCGSRWLSYEDRERALQVMEHAIDSGVVYLDTAHNYGRGRSEQWIGELMPRRRREVLVQTKVYDRNADDFRRAFDTSLERLGVDYVDTLLIHQVEHDDDLERIEARGGPLEALYSIKEEKLARWIGFSSHTSGNTVAKFLRRHDVDVVQMALNVATSGPYDIGHEEEALPVAVEKGVGVIAMKVMGQDNIANKYEQFPADKCLRYSLSLPVTTATVGMPQPEHLERNLELVRSFRPFSPEEMVRIKQQAEGEIETSFLDYMKNHTDRA